MPTTTTLPNPVGLLGSIVRQLYDLAANSHVPATQRRALLLQAHGLRGHIITLAAVQFSQNTADYQSVRASLNAVTWALKQAQKDITQATSVVNVAGQLARSIASLLKEAPQVPAVA